MWGAYSGLDLEDRPWGRVWKLKPRQELTMYSYMFLWVVQGVTV